MSMNWWAGEIRVFPFGFAPEHWAACDGTVLKIVDHTMLYAVIGHRYGGDGRRTFALPDLRDRVPVGSGPSSSSGRIYRVSDKGGEAGVKLTTMELPPHGHGLLGRDSTGNNKSPAGRMFAEERFGKAIYRVPADTLAPMALQSVTIAGGTLAHPNVMPTLPLHYCIAVRGIFPTRP